MMHHRKIPVELAEPSDNGRLLSVRNVVLAVALAVILIVGIVGSVQLGKLAPTFNGKVDVAALQNDPTAYDLKDADGAAYVIVAQNEDKTAAENVCFSVVFNFRGYDTMGESFILIAAIAGSLCILRAEKPVQAPIEQQAEEKKEGGEQQ
ncbi:MAG: hypothetical protein LKJ90_05220 [Faecalibacterium sp.]|jgi:multisubunit Na+/H+ antiporter MnhB subunit|nr:hypothetical protein [Faecalibacterium sp.]